MTGGLMSPRFLKPLLLLLCFNAVALPAFAGVLGSAAFDSQISSFSPSDENEESVPTPILQRDAGTSGIAIPRDIPQVQSLGMFNVSLLFLSDNDNGQKFHASAIHFVPQPFPDPLLKIPIGRLVS
jgi:hypothetical protein